VGVLVENRLKTTPSKNMERMVFSASIKPYFHPKQKKIK